MNSNRISGNIDQTLSLFLNLQMFSYMTIEFSIQLLIKLIEKRPDFCEDYIEVKVVLYGKKSLHFLLMTRRVSEL
jgi:hypothetical protein